MGKLILLIIGLLIGMFGVIMIFDARMLTQMKQQQDLKLLGLLLL